VNSPQLDAGPGASKVSALHNLVTYASVCVLLPVTSNFFIYYGFITNYTTGVFSESGFHGQYDFAVYRYRVLGKAIFLSVYRLVSLWHLESIFPSPLRQPGPHFSAAFYASYFIVNTIFLCLTMGVLWRVFASCAQHLSYNERFLWLLLCQYCVVITGYAVTPYDAIAYFFLSLSILIILISNNDIGSFAALSVVVILGALTRETEALALSFYAVIHYRRYGLEWNRSAAGLAVATVSFLAVYIGLRVALGAEAAPMVHSTTRTVIQLAPISARVSLLFAFAILFLVCFPTRRVDEVLLFQVFALPYTIATFVSGIAFESRLWVPLILPSAVIAVLDHRLIDRAGQIPSQPS
jgi:hypothetical protein